MRRLRDALAGNDKGVSLDEPTCVPGEGCRFGTTCIDMSAQFSVISSSLCFAPCRSTFVLFSVRFEDVRRICTRLSLHTAKTRLTRTRRRMPGVSPREKNNFENNLMPGWDSSRLHSHYQSRQLLSLPVPFKRYAPQHIDESQESLLDTPCFVALLICEYS